MKTSSAKAKGRRCAKEAKTLIHKYFPKLADQDISVTPSGVTGPDIHLSAVAEYAFPFVSECKNVEKINIWEALAQAESHKGPYTESEPLLWFKRNNSKLYVALDAETFTSLMARLQN